jgi:CRP/FNR family transcriptional regulator, cyclic AMP receptor protein
MAPDGWDVLSLRTPPWRGQRDRDTRPESPPLYAYLLDADDDLAEELDIRMRFSARQRATARVLEAETGECDLTVSLVAVKDGPGLLVLDGLLAAETRVADRTVSELVGSGDLLQPASIVADEMIERVASWRALSPIRLAVLDADFAERVRPWPQITQALLRRAERRADELGLLRAITSQPRLEVRLVLLLWHLAARWGRVEPAGIRLSMPLTHRALGQLVSAERPSITHALGRLAGAGLVTGTAGDWHLHGSLDEHLHALIDRPAPLTQRTVGRRRSRSGLA